MIIFSLLFIMCVYFLFKNYLISLYDLILVDILKIKNKI